MKYDWIKDIPDYQKFFTDDQKKMIELIGLDNYMKLHDNFGGTGFYFSNTSIINLKKCWVKINKHIHYNDAARILDAARSAIYKWREEAGVNNIDLFEKP